VGGKDIKCDSRGSDVIRGTVIFYPEMERKELEGGYQIQGGLEVSQVWD